MKMYICTYICLYTYAHTHTYSCIPLSLPAAAAWSACQWTFTGGKVAKLNKFSSAYQLTNMQIFWLRRRFLGHTTRCCLYQCWVARRVSVACHRLHWSGRLLTRPVRKASIASSRTVPWSWQQDAGRYQNPPPPRTRWSHKSRPSWRFNKHMDS